MAFEYCYLIPLIEGFFFVIGSIVLYIVAVSQGHVYPIFPFISDLGLFVPERCIFSQMMNLGALLMGASIYFRYGYVKLICKLHKQDLNIQTWNKRSLKVGICGLVAIHVLANFVITEVPYIHIAAAATTFSNAIGYLCIQTWISVVLYPIIGSKKLIFTRIILTSVATISFIIHPILAVGSAHYYKGEILQFDFSKWGPEDGGYQYHLIAVATEWSLFLSIIFYVATFTSGLKDIVILTPELVFKEDKNQPVGR